jgi:hypothetical protein
MVASLGNPGEASFFSFVARERARIVYWTIDRLRIPVPFARLDVPPKGRRSAARQVGQGMRSQRN